MPNPIDNNPHRHSYGGGEDAKKIQDAAFNIVNTLKSIIEDKETEISRNKKYFEQMK